MTNFYKIADSSIFMIGGPEIDLTATLIDLVEEIKSIQEVDWYLGENRGPVTLVDVVVGAYWALSEWHGGQNSEEYRALSALGDIYSPGMTIAPQPSDPEYDTYILFGDYYEELKS